MRQGVFGWVLGRLAEAGLLKGKMIGVDATTLEANAAPPSTSSFMILQCYPATPPHSSRFGTEWNPC
jgi:hypothetical protein